ncbi:sensor histidine kinase [Alicyclobacillus ferrooxydans]|uniref:histidine kinase n=1 Tax=Alicyclobacillus ferrooxydans TaxID=471514 RepID=A0A0P9CK86_9BACL|nr:sensor histidine kinase [Alicyclobacillus ferrooxydans]KPV43428.1 histidine kinase [Alicyclobacillus ferrooxydans]
MGYGELPTYDHMDLGIRLLEEERRRIARDLHDGPTQMLTNISMRLELLDHMMDTNPGAAKQELSRINNQVIQSINAVRRLLFDLRPIAVDEVGLIKAVEQLVEKYAREYELPVSLEVKHDIGRALSPAKQVALYRLIQEILNNIKKHAAATQITITFEQVGQSGVVSISDNGKGFDPSNIPAGHYGIVGIRERAAYMNGSLDIVSHIGRGSVFSVSVPLTS